MIGVAVSTHARPDVLAQSLAGWAHAMPDLLVVAHDVTGEGVAATKNRGIAALMDAGCEHLFLADDDVAPLTPDPFTEYVNDPLPHLTLIRPNRDSDWTGDPRYRTRTGRNGNGVLMYVERQVVEKVGGFRSEYGRYGSEHADWSRRIHNAGFTPATFIGLNDEISGRLWRALDFNGSAPTTVPPEERRKSKQARRQILAGYWDAAPEFVEYR